MTKKFWTQPLVLITLFGVFLFGLLSLSVRPAVSDDSPTYIGCAEAIFRLNAGDCSSARTPGYPLLILITDTMFGGAGFIVTVWAQYLLLLASAYLLYKLCLLLFNDKTAGHLAFFLTATYPLFLFYSNNVLTEIPFVFLLTSFVYYSIKYLYEIKTKDIIIASLFLAISILTRPFALYLIIPLFALIIAVKFGDWKGALRHGLLAALVCGVVLAPWIYKNVQQYHSASLQYLSGIALWTNVYQVDKLPIVDSQMFQKEKQLIKAHPAGSYIDAYKTLEAAGYSPAEYDRALTAISLESIKAHPVTYISKTAKNFIKLALYPKYAFGDYLVIEQNENLRQNNFSRYFYYAFNDLAHKVNYPVILLTLLGISGIAMSLLSDDKKRKTAAWFITAIILACLAIPAATIIPNVRYRIVIDQLLMLFASYALLIFWRRLELAKRIKETLAR